MNLTLNNSGKERILQFIIEVLEYVLVVLVLAECTSFFTYYTAGAGETKNQIQMVATIILTILLFVKIVSNTVSRREWVKKIGIIVPAELCLFFYYFFSVSANTYDTKKEFIIRFLVFLPLLIAYFIYAREEGKYYEILFKFSNLFTIYGLINLLVYICILFNYDNMTSDLLIRYVDDRKYVGSNFYNIVCLFSNDLFKYETISYPRNFGIFGEPGFFAVPIMFCLCIELFLRRDKKSVIRSIIYTLLFITSGSSLGLMMCALAWGLFFILSEKIPVKFKILIAIMACAFILGVISNKGKQSTTAGVSSYTVHMGDYKLGARVLKDNFITGLGYGHEYLMEEYMDEERVTVAPGVANSFVCIVATGGVIWSSFIFIPYALGVLYLLKKRKQNMCCFFIGMASIPFLCLVHYRLWFILILAFGISLLDLDIIIDAEKKIKVSARLFPIDDCKGMDAGEYDIRKLELWDFVKRHGYAILGTLAYLILLIIGCTSAWVWRLLKNVYLLNGFYISDSHWKFILLVIAISTCVTFIKYMFKNIEGIKRTESIIILLSLFVVVGTVLMPQIINVDNKYKEVEEDALNEFSHKAILDFQFPDTNIGDRELLCTIRILAYGDENSILDNKRVYGKEVDDAGNCHLEYWYSNVVSANGVVYDIIPEDNVSFSIKASSGYDELKLMYLSKYNCLNQPISRAYYNADGTPSIQGGGYVSVQSVYNIRGRELSRKHYDVNGEKMLVNGSYFEYRRQYDERGNIIREELYDTEGKLARQKTGYAITEMNYDKRDNKIDVKYFDENNFPVMYDNSYHEIKYEYNSAKKIVKTSFYGLNNEPILNKNRVAIVTNDYDEFGNTIRENYYDLAYNIKESRAGYSGFEKEYNDKNKVTYEKYLDANGEVYGDILRYEYDENGRLFRKKYFEIIDGGEFPTLHNGQYAIDEMYYDNLGRMIREEYYGIDGELSVTSSNYAVIQNEYNDYGQKIRVTYYDENRNPVGVNGYQYSEKYYYNEKGQIRRIEYYGADDVKLTLESGQYAEEREYDDKGNIIKNVYYGINGQKVRLNAGYSEKHNEYDENGKQIYEAYFDDLGKPCDSLYGYARKCMEYDENGNKIREAYLNTEGYPAYISIVSGNESVGKNTYTEITYSYDDRNRVTKLEYLDSGKIAVVRGGYSAIMYEYSDDGRVKTTTYLDANGHKYLVADSYATVKNTLDRYNRNVKSEFYNDKMEIVKLPAGQSVEVFEYEKYGYGPTGIGYCDEDLIPVKVRNEYSRIHKIYNNKKKLVTEEYFDEKDNRVNTSVGYSYFVNEYDERGNIISISYYNEKGDFYNIDDAYCVEMRIYDNENRLMRRKYLNSYGQEYIKD